MGNYFSDIKYELTIDAIKKFVQIRVENTLVYTYNIHIMISIVD